MDEKFLREFKKVSRNLYGAAWRVANGTHITRKEIDEDMARLRAAVTAYGNLVHSEAKPK
jgi:hypothetical protein